MKIAIVKTSALGDIIHASFIPSILKKAFPQSSIDWFVTRDLAEILEDNPYIDQIVSLPYHSQANAWQTIKGLLQIRHHDDAYDMIFDLQSLIKSAAISYLLKGKSVGFTQRGCREWLACYFYDKTHDIAYQDSVFKRNTFLFQEEFRKIRYKNNILTKQEKYLFYKKEQSPNLSNILLPNHFNILIFPGASNIKKTYPAFKYIHLIQSIPPQTACNIIIGWGNNKEREIAKNIQRRCQGNIRIKTLNKRYRYRELKALVDQVNIVIGSDTGPVHMAWALRTPSITLFSDDNPAKPERNHPKTPINTALSAEHMNLIKASDILKNLLSLMKKFSKASEPEYA